MSAPPFELRVIKYLMCQEPYLSMRFGMAWDLATKKARWMIYCWDREDAYAAEETRLCAEGEAV